MLEVCRTYMDTKRFPPLFGLDDDATENVYLRVVQPFGYGGPH